MKNNPISTIALLLTLSLSIFIGSCATLKNEEISWRKYYDKEGGQLKEMSFGTTVYQMNHKAKQFGNVGYARIKNGKHFNIFKHDDTKQFALINLDTGQPLKDASVENFQQLATAKSIKLFEFVRGRLEVAEFHSQNGVCQDFYSKTGVNTTFATNYYKQYDVFVTAFGEALLSMKNRKPTNIKANIQSYPNTEAATKLEQQLKDQLDKLSYKDSMKLGSFLQLLCNRK